MQKSYTGTASIISFFVVIVIIIFSQFVTNVDGLLHIMLIIVMGLLVFLTVFLLSIHKDFVHLLHQSEEKKNSDENTSENNIKE